MLNALIAIRHADPSGVARAHDAMRVQGFVLATKINWQEGAIEGWSRDPSSDGDECTLKSPEGCMCVAGTIWYRGAFARAALQRILADVTSRSPIDEKELRGNFALFVRWPGGTRLINDPLGLVKIHSSADGRFFSTSWLAARAYAGTSEIDEVAAVEYVLLGATHSQRSVSPSVSRLALGRGFDLETGSTYSRFGSGIAHGGQRYRRIGEAIENFADHLRTVSADIAAASPNRVSCALSGGFDSRLIVAGLLASKAPPRLFVYGRADSIDVRIATQVAQLEGLSLEVIDKESLERARQSPQLPDVVANSLFFDGLPNDGVLDSGVDRETRLRQCAGNTIALNGGGGEILRNFFHLRGGRYSALDIVRAFYRGFDTGVFRRAAGLKRYESSLAASIAAAISVAGVPSPTRGLRYTREQIELVYPLFRCHHWMGANNSVAVRYGQFSTPLLDLTLVRDACLLPLSWKNTGRFEANLIAALHPPIARSPSAYGFRFDRGPGVRARANEWATLLRPVFVRPWIGAARRALNGRYVSRALVEHWRAVLPGEWRLDEFLDLERLPDQSSFSRALAVEIVMRNYQSS
jgi:asparagine synthase (glutamine-hydrolysing)